LSTNVLDEVGTIAPDAALSGSGPILAYVPTLDDTQPIAPYMERESAVITESQAAAEPEAPAAMIVEPMLDQIPAHQMEEPIASTQGVESAAAAVVGGAAAHFFTVAETEPVAESSASVIAEPAPVEAFIPAVEEFQPEAPSEAVAESMVSVEPEAPKPEPVGDAALAEALAAALDEKEAEERATAAVDAAISTVVEPAVAAAIEPLAGTDVQGISDSKLSDAVSHALEKLRPQLIAEILKDLKQMIK
jgi:hypothetical protein